MKLIILFIVSFLSLGCPDLSGVHTSLSLAKKYGQVGENIDFLQEQVRIIYASCEYDETCFREESDLYFESTICTEDKVKTYGFVNMEECMYVCRGFVKKAIKVNDDFFGSFIYFFED